MMRLNFPVIALLLHVPVLSAQDMEGVRAFSGAVPVAGEGIYYLEGRDNLEYARSMAIQAARADAIGRAFGTAVTASSHSAIDYVSDGGERNSFSSVMKSLQRGVWVRDIEEPKVETFLDGDGSFGFKASVRGLARELKSIPVETRGRVLTGDRTRGATPHEADRLRVGEEFYFSFKAASDGWLAVYMCDEDGTVYRVAPTVRSGLGVIPVTADVTVVVRDDYLKNVADIRDAGEREVYNRVMFIFSPTPFTLPLSTDADVASGIPPTMDYDRFHTWLQEMAVADEHFTVSWQTIRIRRPL
ncbi:MAG: DUF4384 domain-containing protein [Muribaculaceae bacterium]|nr:DUF4384 domain-containing protein [Muribaculaceae bacterium]